MRTEPHRLVFIDETGTNTKMTRARGRCDRGERLRSKAPFGHWKTQTFVAALRCGALTAPWVIDAPMDRAIFETYVRTQLVPTLQQGDIVILSARSQKSRRRTSHSRARRLAAVSAALQPRPQSDRNGLRQTQGASPRHGHAHHRRTLEGHRANLRSLHPRGMRKLLRSRRIWIQMNVRCSSTRGSFSPRG